MAAPLITGSKEDITRLLDELNVSRGFCPVTPKEFVFRDECYFSCDTLASPHGLFINLNNHDVFGLDYIKYDRSPPTAYLNLRRTLRYTPETESASEPVTKLALNTKGGFRDRESKFRPIYHLFLYRPQSSSSGSGAQDIPPPSTELYYPLWQSAEPGDLFFTCTVADLEARGLSTACAVAIKSILDLTQPVPSGADVAWEEEQLFESSYARTLQQISNPPTVPPKGWKCSHCGKEENLWMHLHDGYIGCGRKHYGVPESGCLDGQEGAAVRHWEEDKRNRPLAVKLGSISASGVADVYSYNEDAMVLDPLLQDHLRHFGIDINAVSRTEKTLAELQLDLNKNYEWNRITESDETLQPLNAPGFIGLKNYGNTCYINVVLQLIASVDSLVNIARTDLGNLREKAAAPQKSLLLQTFKTLAGLQTDEYIKQREEMIKTLENEEAIQLYITEHPTTVLEPLLFRHVATSGHKEFSSGRQQDVDEFLRYFFDKLESTAANEPALVPSGGSSFVARLFKTQIEEQLRLISTNKVRVSKVEDLVLSLAMPDVSAVESESKRQRTESNVDDTDSTTSSGTLQHCLNIWAAGEEASLYNRRTATHERCRKTRGFCQFPPYLFFQMRRFYVGDNWQPQKRLDSIQMPLNIDLAPWKATGLRETDEVWTSDDNENEAADSEHLEIRLSLEAMGFSTNAASRALQAVNPPDLESCVMWLTGHLDDPNLNDPLNNNSPPPPMPVPLTSPELESMGFPPLQIAAALTTAQGNIEMATNWILTEGAELSDEALQNIIGKAQNDAANPAAQSTESIGPDSFDEETSTLYSLVAFASHLGPGTNCGHYVLYRRDMATNKWAVFNDEKVAASVDPPINTGYIYLYKRVSL